MELGPAVLKAKHQARKEKQEGLRDRVVRSAVDVSPSFQHLQNPVEGFCEFFTSVVLEEKTQDVAADHWVHAVLEVREESLMVLEKQIVSRALLGFDGLGDMMSSPA
jgi:hypothetical protein